MKPVELTIPAGSAYVGIVRLALGSLARTVGFDEERVDDIRIAVSEACANAVLSNEDTGSTEGILVTWTEAPDRVEVSVSDRGPGGTDDSATQDSQGFSSRLVMSVALLQEIADELGVEPRDGGGTTTKLTFLRSA